MASEKIDLNRVFGHLGRVPVHPVNQTHTRALYSSKYCREKPTGTGSNRYQPVPTEKLRHLCSYEECLRVPFSMSLPPCCLFGRWLVEVTVVTVRAITDRYLRLSDLKAAVLVLPQGRDSHRKHQWGQYFQAKLEEPPTTGRLPAAFADPLHDRGEKPLATGPTRVPTANQALIDAAYSTNPYSLLNSLPMDRQWYTVLDLKDAFFERHDPEVGINSQLTLTRLPQGFKNSSIFDESLHEDLGEYRTQNPEISLLQYLDDLLIAAAD
ncbi:hypothetical protein STEG23_019058 [Scotinomys teguina]